jgi:hypothetical protein
VLEILIRSVNKSKSKQIMPATILKAKYKVKAKKPYFNIIKKSETLKNMLSDLILKKGLSIYEAAISCDIDEAAARRSLFSKKPTAQQINRAIEIYDKGLSLLVACVASGVSVEHFRKAKQERFSNKFNPQRW